MYLVRFKAVVLAALPCAFILPAQPQVQPEAKFNTETRAVQINVVVRDSASHPVRGLRKEDFILTDNKRPREIQFFSEEDSPPNSPSRRSESLAAGQFTNRFASPVARPRVTAIVLPPRLAARIQLHAQMVRAVKEMQPGETIAVFGLPYLNIIQDYTTDPQQVLRALDADLPPVGRAHVPPDPYYALRAIAASLASAPGRKRVLWLDLLPLPPTPRQPGFEQSFNATVDLISRANIALYGVDIVGVDAPSLRLDSPQPGSRIAGGGQMPARLAGEHFGAEAYGGEVLYAGNAIHGAIQKGLDDSWHVYSLGFYLPASEADGKTHNLVVEVAGKPKLELHYRPSYAATIVPPPTAEEASEALLSPVDESEILIDATVSRVDSNGRPSLRVSVMLDPSTLKRGADGTANINELFAEQDAQGDFVARIDEKLKLRWPQDKAVDRFERLIPLQDGATTVRLVVHDAATGRIGSLTIPLSGLSN